VRSYSKKTITRGGPLIVSQNKPVCDIAREKRLSLDIMVKHPEVIQGSTKGELLPLKKKKTRRCYHHTRRDPDVSRAERLAGRYGESW
jgi:hypothetical protein